MRRGRTERACIDELEILLGSQGWFPRSLIKSHSEAHAQGPAGLGAIEPDLVVRLEGHVLQPTVIAEIDGKGPGLAYAVAKYGAWIHRHGLPEIWSSHVILVSAFAEVHPDALSHHEDTARWVGTQVVSLVPGGLLRHEVVTLRGKRCVREERGVDLARRCFHRIREVLSELCQEHPVDADEFLEGMPRRAEEHFEASIREDPTFQALVRRGLIEP